MEDRIVAEVVAIGDELTSGQRLDTNTRWLSERLGELGVVVGRHTTVGDDLSANSDVFRVAATRADVVVSTGGLGPTADDLTRDALAAAAGVPLVDHAESIEHIETLFRSRGRPMPPQNRRQGQFPEGASPIANGCGTAPGVDFVFGDCRFFALPGVPAEMRPMWQDSVAPAIAGMAPPRVTRHYLVRCFGVGESQLESMLPEMIARTREPRVGITASTATLTLRVTVSGRDAASCDEAAAPTLEEIRETLGELVFAETRAGEFEPELQHVVAELLRRSERTCAVVETMTRGLLASWLAEADGDNGRLIAARYVPATEAAPSDGAKTDAAADYTLGVGAEASGSVPIRLTPAGEATVERSVRLTGRDWLDRPLVAKSALDLLRRELLRVTREAP